MKKHAIYGPGLRFVSVLHESGTVSDWYENKSCRVSDTPKSDRSEFIFRPAPCKCIKRNVLRPVQTRLDYQPLFGKTSPHSSPRKSGWTRSISFVGLSQSCYRPQIFVWQRLSQKLSHQNKKSFLDPSHGIAISTARRHQAKFQSPKEHHVWCGCLL